MKTKPVPGQLPLDFDPPRARRSDPKTSHDAAAMVKAGTIRALILGVLKQRDLATFQIAEALGLDRDSVSPHMKPLEELGQVVRTGQTVASKKGRQCEVWGIKQDVQET